MPHSLSALNQMSQDDFTNALGPVFEATPSIAAQAWQSRPFESIDSLHQAMADQVRSLSPEAQLALICAHPDLGSRTKMAEASVQEQASAGLDALPPATYERFQRLNQAYRDRFGFPFIIAVAHHTPQSILDAFERRLQNSLPEEQQQALQEILKIAHTRLDNWVTPD